MIMLVVGHFWLNTSFGWRQVIGIGIALSGVLIVISGGDLPHFLSSSLGGSNLFLGLFLMVFSAVGWGCSSLWGKRFSSPDPGGSLLSNGINQFIGVIPVWILCILFEGNTFSRLQPEAWFYILYLGLVPSALGSALFYHVLKDLNLNQASTIQLLTPVFTALLAIAFLGEPSSLALIIGIVILLAGVRFSTGVSRLK